MGVKHHQILTINPYRKENAKKILHLRKVTYSPPKEYFGFC